MSQPPSPSQAKKRLLKAIKRNEPAEELLYEILKDASVTIGPATFHIWANFNDNLKEYADVWLLLCSKKGREYVKRQIDAIFDYIEFMVKYEEPT